MKENKNNKTQNQNNKLNKNDLESVAGGDGKRWDIFAKELNGTPLTKEEKEYREMSASKKGLGIFGRQ